MLFTVAVLIAGLALLVFAGDYLVRGAVGLAENMGISPLVIGLTIVAFGTSAPELFISVQAALGGNPGIAIGNVIGSNVTNVLLVLGVPALIATIHVTQQGIKRTTTFMIVTTVVAMAMMHDGMISRLEGLFLVAAIAGFIFWQLKMPAPSKESEEYTDDIGEAPHEGMRIALYLFGGLVGLPLGAQLTVNSATEIAQYFGVSDAVIGLTIVAIGTSLPELATSVMAAYRKSSDVAIGNVVGSNIFNLTAILGTTAIIIPLPVEQRFVATDMWVMLASALVLAVIIFARINIGKALGAALTAGFAAYIVSVF